MSLCVFTCAKGTEGEVWKVNESKFVLACDFLKKDLCSTPERDLFSTSLKI